MDAAQAAALELLKEQQTELGERARIIWHERFESSKRTATGGEAPDVSEGLEHATFFTELRREDRSELRKALWPEPRSGSIQYQFRERQQRAQMLETAARLGHSLIDLYILTIHRLGSLEQRTLEVDSGKENAALERRRINEYLDVLEKQRTTLLSERSWAAFDELKQISDNFDLILDVNAPEVRTQTFAESRRALGSILGEQQPVGGMSGQINRRLVQQFRMPGYPLTDLLQEGEDLHTFCSAVHHYGIAWTPSSMEQRIGRIDRVRSQSDRRLSGLDTIPDGADLLQVYYPHLEDTVEVLQVQLVLERMNTFLRLMHEGLSVPKGDHRRVDVSRELVDNRRTVEGLSGRLRSAFPIPEWALRGERRSLAIDANVVAAVIVRFERLSTASYPGSTIVWERSSRNGILSGSITRAPGQILRFDLQLKSDGEQLLIRCVSPIGRVEPKSTMVPVEENVRTHRVRLGARRGREETHFDLTVEDEVLLTDRSQDIRRVGLLLNRVMAQSDICGQTNLPLFEKPSASPVSGGAAIPWVAAPDWRHWCRHAAGMSSVGNRVEVFTTRDRDARATVIETAEASLSATTRPTGRHQRISIRETAETFELTSIVARAAAICDVPDVALRAWRRNQAMQLVGFRLDQKGRLLGEAWVPKAGLTRDEFLLFVKRLADECDLFEYHLTGKDRQ